MKFLIYLQFNLMTLQPDTQVLPVILLLGGSKHVYLTRALFHSFTARNCDIQDLKKSNYLEGLSL